MDTVLTNISVIIPTYNSVATITRALDSVLAQTRLPAEVIIVDDASHDGTTDVARSYWQQRNGSVPLRLLKQAHNCGPGTARNVGWEIASGPLIAFLDADDTWHPRKLELQGALFDVDPELMLAGHPAVITPSINWRDSVFKTTGRVLPFCCLLLRNWLPTPSVMLRREVMHRFPERQYLAEDYYLWLLIAADGAKCFLLDQPLCALHKPAYGASGLSKDLRSMQLAEVSVFRRLEKSGHISSIARRIAETSSGLRLCVKWARVRLGRLQKPRQ